MRSNILELIGAFIVGYICCAFLTPMLKGLTYPTPAVAVQYPHGPYTLPPLGYAYNGLEPSIDAETMELHYTKHHQKYVDELNLALSEFPELQAVPLETLLADLSKVPEKIRVKVEDNGGGHFNHSMFWLMMTPGGSALSTQLKEAIEKDFETVERFKQLFAEAAKKRFGSGWAWLSYDRATKKLVITSTPNQDTPLAQGLRPILCLDVWEHAYYLKYHNKRPDYIESWWHVVNWPQVEQYYMHAIHQ